MTKQNKWKIFRKTEIEKKDVEHGKLAVENIHPQEKEKGEGLKSELDGKEHDNNLEDKNSGCHIENMIGYVNNEETFGRDKNESTVETVHDNVDGLNTNDDVTVADMLFQGETEEEKEERMQVIGTSLKSSQLEDDLDNILQKKLRVSDTEERIDRLRNVITLLQGFTYSGKEKEDKDSLKTGENDGNKKESEEQHTEKDKSGECQKGIKEHNSVHNRSKEDDENEEENGSSLPVSKNLEEYVKNTETNVDIEKTEKEKDQIEERNDENINESTGKTEENTSDLTDTGNKCSVENGSENEKKYVNTKDLENYG